MRMLGILLLAVSACMLSTSAPALRHVKASDFGVVRHVRMSDFLAVPAVADCPCKCPCDKGNCTCKPGKCECKKCPGNPPPKPAALTYGAAAAKAIAERRGLVVWIGMARDHGHSPASVHVEVASGWQGITGPARVDSHYNAGHLYYTKVAAMRQVARPVVRFARGGNC